MSLECYVCDNQDGNTDKCLNTIKTCEQEDDRCLSIIRWSTTPYWSQVSRQKFKLYIHSRLNFNSKDFIYKTLHFRIFHLFHREPKNSIMYRKCARVKQTVKKKFGQLCPFAIIYGTKTGNVLNAAKEIDAIIISR